MKYTKIKFIGGKFEYTQVNHLNSYTKNTMYTSVDNQHMYVDTDKLEIGKKKFKKDLLKHYNNIIQIINDNIKHT